MDHTRILVIGEDETLQQKLETGTVMIESGTARSTAAMKESQEKAWTELFNKHTRKRGKF